MKVEKMVWFKRELVKSKLAKVIYGTMHKHKPTTVYLKYKTWSHLKQEHNDYKKVIKILNKSIRQLVLKSIDRNIFNPDYSIVIIDYPERLMNLPYGRPVYMQIEINLKQVNQYSIDNKDLINSIKDINKKVLEYLQDNKYYEFNVIKNV